MRINKKPRNDGTGTAFARRPGSTLKANRNNKTPIAGKAGIGAQFMSFNFPNNLSWHEPSRAPPNFFRLRDMGAEVSPRMWDSSAPMGTKLPTLQ
jgi:hypothetical protein